jgi:hypothetical protein
MLREEAPKLLRVGADFDASRLMHRLNVLTILGQDGAHGCDALTDNPGIAGVEGDSEPEDTARVLGKAAIAEIEA